MPHLKVTLYIRITTADGKRKMCKPVYASRGRLKPLYAADAKGKRTERDGAQFSRD
jgi:hypothetical protein